MPAIGGDILEVSCNHATLGSVIFYPKAGEDSTIDTGGFRSSDEANMIDGGGNMIDQMNRARWSVETVLSHDTVTKQDLDKLDQLTSSPVLGVWTVTHISGTVYRGTGKPVGDVKSNLNQATIQLKLAGGGKLKKIV